MKAPSPPVVLFDGLCELCDGTVRFLIARDRRAVLRFAPLESDVARGLLADRHHEESGDEPGLLLVEDDRVFERSDAVLRIAALLGRPWSFASASRVMPRVVRERLYRLLARNRYRIFGRRSVRRLPEDRERERYL